MGFDLGTLLWAFLMVGGLMLMMRWIFTPSRPRTGRPEHGPGADLGLLRPVLSAAPRASALDAKNLLSAEGIRCSVSRLDSNSYDVLVFTPDEQRAQQLLHG